MKMKKQKRALVPTQWFHFWKNKTDCQTKCYFCTTKRFDTLHFFRFDHYHRHHHHQQQMLISEHDRRPKQQSHMIGTLMSWCEIADRNFGAHRWSMDGREESNIIQTSDDIWFRELIIWFSRLTNSNGLRHMFADHTSLPISAPFINLTHEKPSSIRRCSQLNDYFFSSEPNRIIISWILSLIKLFFSCDIRIENDLAQVMLLNIK